MNNELTDRQFWSNYWESKTGLAVAVGANYLFHKQLQQIVGDKQVKTALELGGFPGYYSIFLKKYLNVKATLMDYFVHRGILKSVIEKNGLSETDIEVIEADLFTYKGTERFDLVLSCGLIEHFEDTKDIIYRHVQFLNPGGTLFITLPNFTGVNGWVQQNFDPQNYSKHNIKTMNPAFLASVARDLGLQNVSVSYFGGFSIWLENKKEKSFLTRALLKTLWLAGKVPTKLLGFESKLLSPYLVLIATI